MRRCLFPLAVVVLVTASVRPAFAQADALSGCKVYSTLFDNFTPIPEPTPDQPNRRHNYLKGHVEIVCDDSRLFADEIEWVSDDDWVLARGHVFLQQLNIRINAETARLNRRTHLGTFDAVAGTIQMSEKKAQGDLFGGMEPDALFSGERLEKIGLRTYRLTNGQITTCTQPTPRWEMGTTDATITPGEHVLMRNMVLRVKDVPLFYLPLIYYPISKEGRSTGFLMPSYGSSSVTGFNLSNAFFWAINRSEDATFYDTYFSKTGQSFGSEYRYVSAPGSTGNVQFTLLDQHAIDNADGSETPGTKSYTVNSNVNQALPDGLRVIGRVNYFSSIQTQQTYQQNVFDLSQRTSSYTGTVSGGIGPYRFDAGLDRSDLFTGDTPAQRTGHLPLVDFSLAEKPIGHTKIYVSFSSQAGYFVQQANVDDPTTDRSLWRENVMPSVRVPLSTLPFFNVTTSANWQLTTWSLRLDPTTSTTVPTPIARQLFTFSTTIDGPVFSRVFQTPDSGYADKLKHVIEPTVTIAWVSPFSQFDQIVQSDNIDQQVGGTTNITYGVTNHFLARRKAAADGTPGTSNEILTIKLNQTYATNPLVTAFDPQYQSDVSGLTVTGLPSNFSPLALSVTAAPTTTVNGQFSLDYDTQFDAVRTYNATGQVHTAALQLSATWSKDNVIPGLAALGTCCTIAVHSVGSSVQFRPAEKHTGGSYTFNYDLANHLLVQQRLMVYYNSQCCGISVYYQSLGAYAGLPGDHRFGFSFSLAGLGSFANPFGAGGDGTGIR